MAKRAREARIQLTDGKRTEFENLAQSATAAPEEVLRARVLLGAAEGKGKSVLAKALGTGKNEVSRILREYEAGEAGPDAAPGTPSRVAAGKGEFVTFEAASWLASLARQSPSAVPGAPMAVRWSPNTLAEYARVHCLADGHSDLFKVTGEMVQQILRANIFAPIAGFFQVTETLDGTHTVVLDVKKDMYVLCSRVFRQVRFGGDKAASEAPAREPAPAVAGNPEPSGEASFALPELQRSDEGVAVLLGFDLVSQAIYHHPAAIAGGQMDPRDFLAFLDVLDQACPEGRRIVLISGSLPLPFTRTSMDYLDSRSDRFVVGALPGREMKILPMEQTLCRGVQEEVNGVGTDSRDEFDIELRVRLFALNDQIREVRKQQGIDRQN